MRNYIDGFLTNLVGKKIMIAGSNGYIGTELVHQLELNNIHYTGIDKTPSSNKNKIAVWINVIKNKRNQFVNSRPISFIITVAINNNKNAIPIC